MVTSLYEVGMEIVLNKQDIEKALKKYVEGCTYGMEVSQYILPLELTLSVIVIEKERTRQ